jgi:carbon-monoxide dehydrogenase medium subunit
MKPPPFAYHRPATVEEAARLLADLTGQGDDAKVLAGGQSLVPLLNFRLAQPQHLVDVNRVDGLGGLSVDAGSGDVAVGATVRTARLLRSPEVAAAHPLLVEATGWIAHAVIRNRGTVCGSLAHGDPAAELPAVLALLDGHVEAVRWDAGALASRRIGAADLYEGPLMTTLGPDELVVRATFPGLGTRAGAGTGTGAGTGAGTGWAVEELARRHGDYALAGVAVTVAVDAGGTPTAGRAAYLSCAPTPIVLDLAPALPAADDPVGSDRIGRPPPGAPGPPDPGPGPAGGAVYDLVAGALAPTDDIHAPADYRRHLAATLTVRAVGRALARARAGGAVEVTA